MKSPFCVPLMSPILDIRSSDVCIPNVNALRVATALRCPNSFIVAAWLTLLQGKACNSRAAVSTC